MKSTEQMQENIFSVNYVKCIQEKIVSLIEEENLEEAMTTLNKLPYGSNAQEKIDRILVLNEGYKAIIETYQESQRVELSEYKKLGEADEIREKLQLLQGLEYRLGIQ